MEDWGYSEREGAQWRTGDTVKEWGHSGGLGIQ